MQHAIARHIIPAIALRRSYQIIRATCTASVASQLPPVVLHSHNPSHGKLWAWGCDFADHFYSPPGNRTITNKPEDKP
jgi:hypothetical protein